MSTRITQENPFDEPPPKSMCATQHMARAHPLIQGDYHSIKRCRLLAIKGGPILLSIN